MFRFIELCIFLCCLVLFVSTLARRLAGNSTLMSLMLKGFPIQRMLV